MKFGCIRIAHMGPRALENIKAQGERRGDHRERFLLLLPGMLAGPSGDRFIAESVDHSEVRHAHPSQAPDGPQGIWICTLTVAGGALRAKSNASMLSAKS